MSPHVGRWAARAGPQLRQLQAPEALVPPHPPSRPSRRPSASPASPAPSCRSSLSAPRMRAAPCTAPDRGPRPARAFFPLPPLSNAVPPIGCLPCHSATLPAAVGRRCEGGGPSWTLYKGRRGAALLLLRRARRTDVCLLPCSCVAMANPVVFFDIAANSEPLGRVTFEVGAGGGRGGAGGAAAVSSPGARGRWGASRRRACAAGARWWLRGCGAPGPAGRTKGPERRARAAPEAAARCQPRACHRPRQSVRTWSGAAGSPLPPASLPPRSRRASAPPRAGGRGSSPPLRVAAVAAPPPFYRKAPGASG